MFANYDIKKDDIGQFLGINGTVPQVVDVEGHTILLYNSAPKDKKKDFCPPGAKPFPTEAYQWLDSDKGDRNMGVKLPPMPDSVASILRGDDPKPVAITPRKPRPPKP